MYRRDFTSYHLQLLLWGKWLEILKLNDYYPQLPLYPVIYIPKTQNKFNEINNMIKNKIISWLLNNL